MICLAMQDKPFLITCLYKICFYNAGFIGSNDGPFTILGNAIMRKNSAFDTWTSQGSSWTLRSLGNLDIMDLLDLWISWRALGFLTSTTFWKF